MTCAAGCCAAVLLGCADDDGPEEVLGRLRRELARRAVQAADVDGAQDVEALRAMLRQAQAALRSPT